MRVCRVLVLLLAAQQAVSGQVNWWVDVQAAAPGSGTQASPFPTIQAAICASAAGDIVLVRPGFYSENLDFLGKPIIVRSTNGAAVTEINGGQAGSVVTFENGEGTDSVLYGFTISGGVGAPNRGGGIHLEATYPTIVWCRIVGNVGGDGLPWPFLTRGGAGGIQQNIPALAGPTIAYCTISGNAGGDGNQWTGQGGAGGIYCDDGFVLNCVITANSGGCGGPGPPGGLSLTGTCLGISPQGGRGGAGGLSIGLGVVTNCVITANSGGPGGPGGPGAVSVSGQQCIAGFPGPVGIGGLYGVGATTTNTIVWGNTPTDMRVSIFTIMNFSDVGTTIGSVISPGSGNISADPFFAGVSSGDFHLRLGSPCIDSGDNAAPQLSFLATDLDHAPRINGGIVDMGAYETSLTLFFAQPLGPGAPLLLRNEFLVPGREYFNVFSLEACPGPPGSGQVLLLGLCPGSATNVQFLVSQLLSPLGTPPFHFLSSATGVTFGPFALPPMTIEGVGFEFTAGAITQVSAVARFTIQ